MEMESYLDWALRYAALGLPVVPLYGIDGANCTCNKPCSSPGKHPIPWRGLNEASLDAGQIEKWWTKWPAANLGVRTGGSVIVLDIDGEAGAASIAGKVIQPTWMAKTGRGRHVWFRHPGGRVANFAHRLPGLDLRGDGGYVVVPPSVHVSGVGYVWLASPWDIELAEAPGWLLELIASSLAPKPSSSTLPRHQSYPTPDTATPDWAALLQGVPEGQRHDVAVRAAGHYLGIGIDPEEVEAMLLDFAARCQPPHDPQDVKRIVRDLAAKDAAKRGNRILTVELNNNATSNVTTEDAEGALLLTDAERQELSAHERAVEAEDFVIRWVRWGSDRTDAPRIFHLSNAIALVATAIDRNRWVAFQHKRVYPSAYLLNIAGSGDRKSTPMGYAKEALAAAYPKRLLSNDYSPEALIADLAERGECSRGTAFIDEAGRILGTMRTHGYGEGLKDLLSELWDGPESFSRTLKKESYLLQSVYINLVMATTNSRFLETVSSEDVTSGFFARFLPFVVSERVERRRLSMLTSDTKATGEALVTALRDIGLRLDHPAQMAMWPAAVDRLDAAEQAIEEWAGRQYHGDLIVPWSKRLAEYASRLAIIFAVSEGVEQITVAQVLRAVDLVERATGGVAVLVRQLLSGPREREIERLRQFIEKNAGISRRDICRRTDLRSEQVADYAAVLKSRGEVMIQANGTSERYFPVQQRAAAAGVGVSGVGLRGRREAPSDPPTPPTPDSSTAPELVAALHE
jgi:hypothetical protein